MNRLSFRPRPVDIHKKLPIVKSVRDLDNEDAVGVSRMVQHGHVALDSENELVLATAGRRGGAEIPTPEFVAVDSYEKLYTQTFAQPPSYLRSRARQEGSDFVEYDLDNDDEEWLDQLNKERKILPDDKFERMLYKLELADHKARERQQPGMPARVHLSRESGIELLHRQHGRALAGAVYDFWKEKRERWEKPILRRLQPPPPVNDTNPFNVFRPREKIHRPHTRRMQRRENDLQSFEKLRQVRRNLEQAKSLLHAVQKREEKKREVVDCEAQVQRVQLKYKLESKLDDDSLITNAHLFPTVPKKLPYPKQQQQRPEELQPADQNGDYEYTTHMQDGAMLDRLDQLKRKRKKRVLPRPRPMKKVSHLDPSHTLGGLTDGQNLWNLPQLQPADSSDPVMLFTKPLDPKELAAAGIITEFEDDSSSHRPRGRIGRGGRIVFDRWNPLTRTCIGSNLPFCSLAN